MEKTTACVTPIAKNEQCNQLQSVYNLIKTPASHKYNKINVEKADQQYKAKKCITPHCYTELIHLSVKPNQFLTIMITVTIVNINNNKTITLS